MNTRRTITVSGEEKPVKTMLGFLPAHVKYIPPTSAPTLAAILKNMDLFIVSATGTMHLAAAVKTAMLSFHSGYTYNCWRPLTENNVSLCGKTWNSCRDISVGDAWQAVAKFPALKK
ncbi:MAG: hypothetical protein NTW04_06045, partial [Elusimicrobia bacterium]|nr:hypothetical protein [Elusimicrobiota bacterium]